MIGLHLAVAVFMVFGAYGTNGAQRGLFVLALILNLFAAAAWTV